MRDPAPALLSGSIRDELLAAAARAVAARGYAATTVTHVAAEARCARATFYKHFASKDDCALAAHDAVVEHVAGVVAAALRGARGSAAERLHTTLCALVAFVVREDALARLWLVEARAGSPHGELRHIEGRLRLAALIARHVPRAAPVSEVRAELVAAGLLTVLRRHVLDRPFVDAREIRAAAIALGEALADPPPLTDPAPVPPHVADPCAPAAAAPAGAPPGTPRSGHPDAARVGGVAV